MIVGDAGIGTVLSAREHGKSAVLVPHCHAMGEHRNDRQMATSAALECRPGHYIAWHILDIAALIRRPDLITATEQNSAYMTRLRLYVADWMGTV